MGHFGNRRVDHQVRRAISEVQELLFDPRATDNIFPLVLTELATITNSQHSAIYILNPSPDSKTKELRRVQLNSAPEFIDRKTLAHWFDKQFVPLRPLYFNDPLPKSHRALLSSAATVNALLILPILVGFELRGVCLLAKSNGRYDAESVRRLMPLMGAMICTLSTEKALQGDFGDLTEKLSGHQFLSTLMSASPLGILVVDQSQQVVVCNPVAKTMFEGSKFDADTNLNIKPLSEAKINICELLPGYQNLFRWSNQRDRYGQHDQPPGPEIFEDLVATRLDGSQFRVNLTAFRLTFGKQRLTTLQLQDVTSLHANAMDYQQASQELAALTHLVPVAIVRINIDWDCVYANEKWYEFSGLNFEENLGCNWINAFHQDDVEYVLNRLRECLQNNCEFNAELRLVSPLGKTRWVKFETKVLFNENGAIEGFLGTFADITERLEYQERLKLVAEYDNLTGLANRRLLHDRLEQAFLGSERNHTELFLFYLDLDGFKEVNDSLGHDVGDQLLKQVAERLVNSLRRTDTIARLGGDEFVVLLSESDIDSNVGAIAAKLNQSIAQIFAINGSDIFVTASIGIASGNSLTSSPDQLLKQADAALYLAKSEGKNNFQLFNENLDRAAKHRVQLIGQLRKALVEDRFFLVYQPLACTSNNKVVGFEALLRFKDVNDEVVSPVDFIPLLEETGMIIEVGQWVLNQACWQIQQWTANNAFPTDGFVSVNMSPKQLRDETIADIVADAIRSAQIDPSQLVIEVTETVLIDKPNKVQQSMEKLKQLGVLLALDDFGTGYSSLTYLQRFPFDHIKIDKSFVMELETDNSDIKCSKAVNITKAIVTLANSLGLKVTAEGVSGPDALTMLEAFGADYYQGYYLGRPMVASNAVAALNPVNRRVLPH